MDRSFHSGVFAERAVVEREKDRHRVEGRVVGPRGGGVRISVGEQSGGIEGLASTVPEIRALRRHSATPSRFTSRYKLYSPASKVSARTGRAWIGLSSSI